MNSQFRSHYKEFMCGYRSSAEAVQVKFSRVDGTRQIYPFSVGINDGHLKVLCMVSLVAFMHELDTRLILWSEFYCAYLQLLKNLNMQSKIPD